MIVPLTARLRHESQFIEQTHRAHRYRVKNKAGVHQPALIAWTFPIATQFHLLLDCGWLKSYPIYQDNYCSYF